MGTNFPTCSFPYCFQEPFCLYPGEELQGAEKYGKGSTVYNTALQKQPLIRNNQAVRLEAITDYTDDEGVNRMAGDQWQLQGPMLYFPSPNCVSACYDIQWTSANKTTIEAGQNVVLIAILSSFKLTIWDENMVILMEDQSKCRVVYLVELNSSM